MKNDDGPMKRTKLSGGESQGSRAGQGWVPELSLSWLEVRGLVPLKELLKITAPFPSWGKHRRLFKGEIH